MYYLHDNGKDVDILIFVEHRDRELEIACSLANKLEQKELNVAIASTIYHQIPCMLMLKPKVIVTPFTGFGRGSVAQLFYCVYGDSIVYINLNYEQFISSWKGSYKTSSHPFSRDGQYQLVWGRYFEDELKNNGVNPENISITGRPSLSVVKSRYARRGRDEFSSCYREFCDKKVCFIALTDGLAFVSKKKIDFIVENGADREGLETHVENVKSNVRALFAEVVAQAEKRKDFLFVMRPHPSLSERMYEEKFEELRLDLPDNVLITKDKNAFWWLSVCQYYVTNYSTLCLEAKALEKPSFLYQKIKNPNVEEYWYTSTAIKVDCLDEIFVHNLDGGNPEGSDEGRFYIDFEKDGVEETVSFIAKKLTHEPPIAKKLPIFVLLANARRMMGSILRNIYAKIGFVPIGRLSRGLLKDYFNKEDVKRIKLELESEI